MNYFLIQEMIFDEKYSQASTVVGQALFSLAVASSMLTILRRFCIQKDFIQISGVNQCFVIVFFEDVKPKKNNIFN